jgi:hypothetical protein
MILRSALAYAGILQVSWRQQTPVHPVPITNLRLWKQEEEWTCTRCFNLQVADGFVRYRVEVTAVSGLESPFRVHALKHYK